MVSALITLLLYYAIGFIVWGWCVNRWDAYMSPPEFLMGLLWRPFLWPVMLFMAIFKSGGFK